MISDPPARAAASDEARAPSGPLVHPSIILSAYLEPLVRGRRHRVQEFAQLELEAVAVAGQRLGRGKDLRRSRTRLGRATLHVGDVGGDLLGALRCLLHIAGDFLRCRALLFHRGRNGRGNLRQPFDGAADFLDRSDRLLRCGLDTGDLLADLSGRFRGLLGQRLHFRRHDREAAASLACARRLNGSIERQQVGLPRNGVDQFNHVADAGGGLRQLADSFVGGAGLTDGVGRHSRGFLHLTADLVDGRRQLFGRRSHRLYVGRGFL